MASEAQNKYIADLTVLKTKEFKEVKELLISSGIVSSKAEIVKNAGTISEINNALTDMQASKFIDLLISTKEPARSNAYSSKRIRAATGDLEHIQAVIGGWGFPE